MDRLRTLEWLAEFVMACPEGLIPIASQKQLIREIVHLTKTDPASIRLFFASSEGANANLKSRIFNELAADDSRNGVFEKQ